MTGSRNLFWYMCLRYVYWWTILAVLCILKINYNVLCIFLENKTFYSAFGYSVVYWWERHSSCRYPQRTNYMENKVLLDLRNIRFSCPVFFKKHPKMASMFFILQCHDVVLNHYLLLLYSTQLRNISHIQKSESY